MSTSTPARPTLPTLPPGKAVDILQTSAAQLFTHLHPILLFAVLPISFGSLVADPVSTLLGLAPTTLVVQALYCTLCLPHVNQTTPSKPKPGQKTKVAKAEQGIWAKLVPAILSLLLTFFLTAPLLYIVAILFGAPLVSHLPHTALLAVHLALLTTPHLFYVHGLDTTSWLRLASLQQPFDEVYGLSLGACAGAWLGAIPIPLDWDREWQKWPVTIICGMYAGAVVGKLAGGYLLKGFKMKML